MASSQPPPRQKPLTAAITGLPQRSNRRKTAWPVRVPAPALQRRLAGQLADVRSGHERLGAGAGEDDPRDGRVSAGGINRLPQLADTTAFRALSLSGRLMVMVAIRSVIS